MDVWFCVPRRNQKQKRYERNCKNIHQPAPSERGTKILAFPLTLLIMDVRKVAFSYKCLSQSLVDNRPVSLIEIAARLTVTGLAEHVLAGNLRQAGKLLAH